MVIRAIESGAVKKIWPLGVLSPSPADQGQAIRGIPVRGLLQDLERVASDLQARGTPLTRLLLTPSALDPEAAPENILALARRLGLTASRLPSLEEISEAKGQAVRLAPIAVEDLLLRPSVKIDYKRLESVVQGKAVVVTGGGGSIGSEICDRVVTFGAARLLVIEVSESALYAVLEALATKGAPAQIEGRLADVRDGERMFRLIADFKPDVVFHAAALKHVPLVERDWAEGVKTNVFGSVNVADAAAEAGAAAMVMISTDKAIEPVSVLGATKRFAEMYCQALDADLTQRGRAPRAMRLIAVRFGNVLASNGSVVPKFKAQIEAGGPVTVTHPDMVRYFMTIREACDLVVTAASHALGPERSDASRLRAQHGPAGEDRRSRRAHDPPVGARAAPRHRYRLQRHPPGRAAQGDHVRARGADRRDRHRWHRGGAPGASDAQRDAGLAQDPRAEPVAPPADRPLPRVARCGARLPGRRRAPARRRSAAPAAVDEPVGRLN